MKLFKCNHCGNIIMLVQDHNVPVVCCGEKMQLLVPNTTDGAVEKHVPVVKREGNKVSVTVGSVTHPMLEEHHICFIILETKNGIQKIDLNTTGEPTAVFYIAEDDEILGAYEYCNLHGFWKA